MVLKKSYFCLVKNKKELNILPVSPVAAEGEKNVLKKILNDKSDINAYFNGNISLDQLQAKGVKLVKAI